MIVVGGFCDPYGRSCLFLIQIVIRVKVASDCRGRRHMVILVGVRSGRGSAGWSCTGSEPGIHTFFPTQVSLLSIVILILFLILSLRMYGREISQQWSCIGSKPEKHNCISNPNRFSLNCNFCSFPDCKFKNVWQGNLTTMKYQDY